MKMCVGFILFFSIFILGCNNELLNEIHEYYERTIEDIDVRPPELTEQGIATGPLTLVASLSGGKTVQWDVSEHNGIDSIGALIQPEFGESDITAMIQATIRYKNGKTSQHTFMVTVPAMAATDAQAVTTAAAVLMIVYQPGDSATQVTGPLGFPLSGLHGTRVSWDASALTSVMNDGSVHRPAYLSGDETGAVIATVSRGSEVVLVNFPLTVMKQAITDLESVTAAAAALSIGYQGGDTSSSITNDLTFITTGLHGTTIQWDASDLSSISDNGEVSQPSFTVGDESGIIIATVAKGSESTTVRFPVTVSRASITDAESVIAAAAALAITYQVGDSASSVTANLTLPTTGLHGTSVSWVASDLSSVTDSGVVSRPSYTTGSESGTLVATVSKGIESTAVNFPITVTRLPITDQEAVNLVANDIMSYVEYAEGEGGAAGVTSDITLLTDGAHGTSIVWNTNRHPQIDSDGSVDTSVSDWWITVGSGVNASLEASISKNGIVARRTFAISVTVETVPSPPVPSSFSRLNTASFRYIQFPRANGVDTVSNIEVEYRSFSSGSWSSWASTNPGDVRFLTSYISLGWSSAGLPTGTYQFRVRITRNSRTGSWGTTRSLLNF